MIPRQSRGHSRDVLARRSALPARSLSPGAASEQRRCARGPASTRTTVPSSKATYQSSPSGPTVKSTGPPARRTIRRGRAAKRLGDGRSRARHTRSRTKSPKTSPCQKAPPVTDAPSGPGRYVKTGGTLEPGQRRRGWRPSHSGHPRSSPARTTSISSNDDCPTSPSHSNPVTGSKAKRNGLRSPSAKTTSAAPPQDLAFERCDVAGVGGWWICPAGRRRRGRCRPSRRRGSRPDRSRGRRRHGCPGRCGSRPAGRPATSDRSRRRAA